MKEKLIQFFRNTSTGTKITKGTDWRIEFECGTWVLEEYVDVAHILKKSTAEVGKMSPKFNPELFCPKNNPIQVFSFQHIASTDLIYQQNSDTRL